MFVTTEMCKCANAFTHLGNMGTGWVGSHFGSDCSSLWFFGSHSCLAADGPHWIAVLSCRVSLGKKTGVAGTRLLFPWANALALAECMNWYKDEKQSLNLTHIYQKNIENPSASTWNSPTWGTTTLIVSVSERIIVRLSHSLFNTDPSQGNKPGQIQSNCYWLLSMELSQPHPPKPFSRSPLPEIQELHSLNKGHIPFSSSRPDWLSTEAAAHGSAGCRWQLGAF